MSHYLTLAVGTSRAPASMSSSHRRPRARPRRGLLISIYIHELNYDKWLPNAIVSIRSQSLTSRRHDGQQPIDRQVGGRGLPRIRGRHGCSGTALFRKNDFDSTSRSRGRTRTCSTCSNFSRRRHADSALGVGHSCSRARRPSISAAWGVGETLTVDELL
jgi:hypothetical protein